MDTQLVVAPSFSPCQRSRSEVTLLVVVEEVLSAFLPNSFSASAFVVPVPEPILTCCHAS